MYCTECGRDCGEKLIDSGTLPLEHHMVIVSDCCEAETADSLGALEKDTLIRLSGFLIQENKQLRENSIIGQIPKKLDI